MEEQRVLRTPTQLEAHQRRLRFQRSIAAKAAELAAHKLSPVVSQQIEAIAPPIVPALTSEPTSDTEPTQLDLDFLASASHTAVVPKVRHLTIKKIQRGVAVLYNLSDDAMRSSSRRVHVVGPRQVAMYLAHVLTDCNMPEIGRQFGGKDHTTVLHAVQKIHWMIGNRSGKPPKGLARPSEIPVDLTLVANIEKLTAQFRV